MIHFDLPKEQSSIIKVIGMGGGGSNAVNFMYGQGIEGVDFIICNTDSQALADSPIPNKVHLGPHLTQGLGAGAHPDIGRQATEESMEELKKILEVNTKMAFITAGMGGGTGTGGAPIVAKICRDLGILTVGIVTSPFSYEGRRRMKQAEQGIKNLKEYVDTLLVISNDKLRMQFGNLPFKAAFAKADNILATAAKCITDVINIHGVVNVDFADVCTAMRNGGVAILGSATADGENRSQKAIDSALSSPLLNDSEINGAKWILLNITSAEGEHEHTIDEMDTIQAYVQQQAGDECDVILGMGHDDTLGEKLGVTIIATGFEQRPIEQMTRAKKSTPKEERPKITVELGKAGEEKKLYDTPPLPFKEELTETPKTPEASEDPMAPKLVESDSGELPFDLSAPQSQAANEQAEAPQPQAEAGPAGEIPEKQLFTLQPEEPERPAGAPATPEATDDPVESGGYLSRPQHIYADEPEEDSPEAAQPEPPMQDDKPEMTLFYKEDEVQPQPQPETEDHFIEPEPEQQPEQPDPEPEPPARQPQPRTYEKRPEDNPFIARTVYPYPDYPRQQQDHPRHDPPAGRDNAGPRDAFSSNHSEADGNNRPGQPETPQSAMDQERVAAERTARLRQLSFDVTKMEDPYAVETVPAYIRKNVALNQNEEPSTDQPYSGYHIKKTADGKQTEISTINTFLDGKKPD